MALIFLTGLPGAGKTKVGEQLAQRLGVPFIDLDHSIEARIGKPIAQIFVDEGEAVFRDYESMALRDLALWSDGVVALGSGALERDANWRSAQSLGKLVYLRADIESLLKRDGHLEQLPMFREATTVDAKRAQLQELLARRQARFEQAAIIVDVTSTLSPSGIAEAIAKQLSAQ